MSQVAVIYWSGTGCTEEMAQAVVEGIKGKGATAELFTAGEFSESKIAEFDGFAFGCSAQGAEVLEEGEFQPMWDGVKSALRGKKVVLFGSYGWGDGEWMRTWVSECEDAGIDVAENYICNETPGDDELGECKKIGAALV